MKALFVFFAFSVSLILTSCSQVDQENSPVAPQMNKYSESPNSTVFPYKYLAEFPELKNVKWEESVSDDEWVIVTMSKEDKAFHHIYCEVIYSDETEPVRKSSELFFAGKPDNFRFAFSKPTNKTISDIRIYAVYDYPSANDISSSNDTQHFPYKNRQKFNSILVNSWNTKESVISVNASDDVNKSGHIFVKIDSKEGNVLVFAAKPASEFFDIPKYGDMGVENINLYGLSYSLTHDAE